MPFCREQSIKATCHFGEVAAPIKCRAWTCPDCAPWRTNCLMARAIEGKPNRFITITCRRGRYATREATAQAISDAWRTVILRWRRLRAYHRCEYFCVFEAHKSGWPHLHVLWKGHWLDWKWLRDQMHELLGSPIVHVSQIKDEKSAVFYVTTYFSKAPIRFGTLKRYWTSKNWPKLSNTDATPVFRKGFPIDRVNLPIAEIKKDWLRIGRCIWQSPPDVIGWGVLWHPTTHTEPIGVLRMRDAEGIMRTKTKRGWLRGRV
jgi:hypothetical protein